MNIFFSYDSGIFFRKFSFSQNFAQHFIFTKFLPKSNFSRAHIVALLLQRARHGPRRPCPLLGPPGGLPKQVARGTRGGTIKGTFGARVEGEQGVDVL
jgi:hypothetical protein